MAVNNAEMMKIFDFILENKNIIIGDNSLFSRNTLMMIRAIVKGKMPNNFELTPEQEQLIITAFINSNNYFNEDTPNFILKNSECINLAIERNINSVNFIENFSSELEQKVLNFAIKQKYILTASSPKFLISNYVVALNSIREDSNSANYVDWYVLKKEEIDNLIQETIKAGYELSYESPIFLTENPDIVLNSIKKDINTLKYASEEAENNPSVFKYLISKGYDFSKSELKAKPLSSFLDKDIMKYALEKLKILDKNDPTFTLLLKSYYNDIEKYIDKYIERYIEFYVKAINTYPKIESFNSVLQVCVESDWNNYRYDNLDDYANIFGKICTELKNNNSFKSAIKNLLFLDLMKNALDDKYNILLQAMEEYHKIIHSNTYLDNIDLARDKIAELSALYISISKENFKKENLKKYFEIIKEYFIPRKNHPIVNRKIIEYKHKEAFIELFEKKDISICDFLEELVKQYSRIIDVDIIWHMIRNFVNNGYSKMDSFIKAPYGWNNYKRYKEACKLINRLNKNYIKYTDKDLVRFLDIIKYDKRKNEYYYDGPTFGEESIILYNEYREKLNIFDKLKQQIIFKARELEINSTISLQDLMDIADELPFNDEYFEFQKDTSDEFTLNDFIDSFDLNNNFILPINLIDNEIYNTLTNYTNNNGLVWMLLLINKYKNDLLEDISIDRGTILATFDSMNEIIKLAKMFNYDISKFKNILTLSELNECANEETIAILGEEIISKLSKYREYTNEDAIEIVNMAKELVCEMTKRDKSTVPYIKGTYGNYKYSMYDSQDETILLSGINTDACFRIDGNDNDFFHYCALDKNGFVIKITDIFGNFIGRASGFRNGNGVYINQLRTIYDAGGIGYEGDYENERLEIIETFRQACNDIVEISQKNKDEQDKIDFVVVTKSYALNKMESNVSREVQNIIGCIPMNTECDDWKNFINNTKNLQEIEDENDIFSTDYGDYALICMASIKEHKIFNKLSAKDIKQKDVKAVYNRPRNKIIGTNNPDIEIIRKINKINGINSYFNETVFESISFPQGATVFIGDNWYIIFDGKQIINNTVLDFDKRAKTEFEIAKATIKQYINRQQFDLNQIVNSIQSQTTDDEVKVLKLNV